MYNRVYSYFMPSILAKADRRVLRYFHKYGFKDITLTLYILNNKATSQMTVQLEQYFMNTFLPTLNVDLQASSTGYHEPLLLFYSYFCICLSPQMTFACAFLYYYLPLPRGAICFPRFPFCLCVAIAKSKGRL